MLYLVIFFILFMVILIFFLISEAKIELDYTLENLDDCLYINLFLVRKLIKYRYQLPSMKDRKRKKKNEMEDSKNLLTGFYHKLKNSRKVLGIIKRIKQYLGRKIVLNELKLYVHAGTGDACNTAILTGALWSGAGVLNSIITNNFRTENVNIQIHPEFANKTFKVKFSSIFTIKVVNIIVVATKFYIWKRINKKAGEKNG